MKFSFIQKFGAALLATVWLLWGSNMIGDWIIPTREAPSGGETTVASAAAPAAKSAAAKPESNQIEDIKPLLAKANIDEGKKLFRKCIVCHTAQKGAGSKVGPDLWNVVGRPKASFDHFSYSDAMKGKGGDWTYDDLNHFIADPRAFVPGTKMTFAGLKKTEQRADVIAYLRTLNDSPPPLPTVSEAAPAAKPEAAQATQPEAKPEAKPATASAAGAATADPKVLLAKASVEEGKKLFSKCKVCHNAAKGAGNKIGPNLWDVVGRPKGTFDGYSYSDAMKKKGGDWTYDDLFHFIADPRKFVPGTKMTFVGLKKPDQQADVIAYLRTLNDSPPPLP